MKICPECQSEYNDDVEFCARDGMKLRFAVAEQLDPLIGKAFDNKWVIEEKIGEGGMGAVYKGYQRGVNRKVAVKTLRAALVDNQEFVDRFFREGRVATTIANPHCVTIYDFGQGPDGTLFLAMEFLDGQPLSDVLKARRLSTREALQVGVQISAALAAAHAARIVHRDLKPDNIFLLHMPDRSTFAKVLDFGIAKDTGSAAEKYTRTGQIFGTPAYMSPEQCTGSALDGRSDLYSLGVILYEIVSQSTPFGGKTTSPMKILLDHVNTPPPPLDAAALALPPGFAAIIMRLLEKSPDARFEDAQALQQALQAELALLDGQDALRSTGQLPSAAQPYVSGHSAPAIGLAKTPTASVELEVRSAPPAAPVSSAKLGLVAVALVSLVLLVAAAAFAVYKGGKDAGAPAQPVEQPVAAQAPAAPEPSAEPAEPDPVKPAEPVVAAPVVEPPDAPAEPAPSSDKKVRDKRRADKKIVVDKKAAEPKTIAEPKKRSEERQLLDKVIDKQEKKIEKKVKDKTDEMVDALGI